VVAINDVGHFLGASKFHLREENKPQKPLLVGSVARCFLDRKKAGPLHSGPPFK
jgi:hypothetical protein